MKSLGIIALLVCFSYFLPAEEKLLFSFEDVEIQKLLDLTKCKKTPGKTDKDPAVIDFNPYRTQGSWSCFQDIKSHGEVSLGLSVSKPIYGKLRIGNEPEKLLDINSVFTPGRGAAFRTIGFLSDMMDDNWSNFEVFRFDVYSMLDDVTIEVLLEDDRVSPFLKYVFPAKKNSWVTCEIDLLEAIKIRELNLAKISSFNIRAFSNDETNKIALPIRLDNFRLAKAKNASKNEIVKNKEPIMPIEFNLLTQKPKAEVLPKYKPNNAKLEKPETLTIETDIPYGVIPVGWVAAYDNDRIMIGYCANNLTNVQQTLDGGKTWTGLGTKEPSKIKTIYFDHQNGTSSTFGERKDVAITLNLGCAGPIIPSVRLFTKHIEHQDAGWVLRETPCFVDSDLRHCNSDQSMFRGKDGRVWLAYGYAGRFGSRTIAMRYSDDDGKTYQTTIKNSNGMIPESIRPEEKGNYGYTFDIPVIVPYQNGVMIIWEAITKDIISEYNSMIFLEGKWSALQKIPIPKERAFNKLRPPLNAVAKTNGEVIVSSTDFSGLLVYKDNQWSLKAIKVPPASKLALAGGTKLFAFTIGITQSGEYVNKKPNGKIIMWSIDDQYEVAPPKEIVAEAYPFSIQGSNPYYARTVPVVDAYSPANFIAIAWTCIDQKWVKIMKIPVD